MATRRRFLGIAGLGAGASWATRGVAAELEHPQEALLPPSIASLKSMKDLAKPITAQERLVRLEKARGLMAQNHIDALMLTGGTSLFYFTGIRWGLSERLFTVTLPAQGKPFIVCPAFEKDRAAEQIALGPLAPDADLRIWQENESPYDLVAEGLRDRSVTTGRLAMEETVRFVFSDGVAHRAPALSMVSGTPITAGCRMHKEPHEIALMRLAAQASLSAYAAAWRALKPGMTQHQFSQMVATAHSRLGFQGGAEIQVGPYSALPHGSVQPQVIREGTILLMDGGCQVEGYASDISRTFVLGQPTAKMKKIFEIVHRAQSTALATARPGVPCEAVDAAARRVIVDAGYGPGYKFFTHRLGHGMGLDGHEWTYLVGGNTLPLAPQMTFSDEPGIYIPGEFGVRLEDDMHITENGAELFTPQSPSLEQPFAV